MKSLAALDRRSIDSPLETGTTQVGAAAPVAPVCTSHSRKNMRVTLNLPTPLLDRMRNTVYWTPGLTLTGLIKSALQNALDNFERQQGRPFPSRLSELKSGRPRKRQATPLQTQARKQLDPRHVAGLESYSN